MQQDPLLANLGGMLRRFKRAENWLRNAGLPSFLARVPVWLLCVHYCVMMEGKTARIGRIAQRISRWLETISELSQNDKARTELLDMDGGMRNDIESTKRTLLLLRQLSVDIGAMFRAVDFRSRILDRTQNVFMAIVDDACTTATTLQRALEMHDSRALMLLREMQDRERQEQQDRQQQEQRERQEQQEQRERQEQQAQQQTHERQRTQQQQRTQERQQTQTPEQEKYDQPRQEPEQALQQQRQEQYERARREALPVKA